MAGVATPSYLSSALYTTSTNADRGVSLSLSLSLRTSRDERFLVCGIPRGALVQFTGSSGTNIWTFTVPKPLGVSAPNGATLVMVFMVGSTLSWDPGHFWNTVQSGAYIGVMYQGGYFYETFGVTSAAQRFTYRDFTVGLKIYFVVADPVAGVSSM